MKILVVHEVSYKKKPVYEYQDFAERLAARGHEVTVIDYDESGSWDYETSFLSRTGLAKVHHKPIRHVNLPVFNVLHARRGYKKSLREALKKNRFDIAFVYSVFVNGTPTVKLFNKYKLPVVYRVLDIYHKIRENPFIQYPLLVGEKYIYRNSNLILTTNQRLSDYVKDLRKEAVHPEVKVLDHGVDCDHFRPASKSPEIMKRLGITPEDKILLYLGTTFGFSGLDIILESLPRIQKSCGKVKFVIVGAGDIDDRLKALAAERGLDKDFIHLGMQPYEKLPELIALADVVLNPFKINEITKSIIPIKMLQYIASGKPCVSAPINDLMKLIPPEISGVRYADIDDGDNFIRELESLLSLSEADRSQVGEKGRAFATSCLSIGKQIDTLEAYFEKVIRLSAAKA